MLLVTIVAKLQSILLIDVKMYTFLYTLQNPAWTMHNNYQVIILYTDLCADICTHATGRRHRSKGKAKKKT